MATSAATLVKWIGEHGHEAYVAPDGAIMAWLTWTEGRGADMVVGGHWERVEPTVKAVRDWLGY